MTKQDKDYLFCKDFLKLQLNVPEISIAVANAAFCGVKDAPNDTCWQVMAEYGTSEYGFWNWYCDNYENDQFYANIFECVVQYLYHRELWKQIGCPLPEYMKSQTGV